MGRARRVVGSMPGLLGWLVLALVARPADASDSVRAEPHRRATLGGFHLEGAAEIDVVFGSTAQYQGAIDRYFELDDLMAAARTEFSRQIHAALAMLAAEPRRLCPETAVAPFYAGASRFGERYRQDGRELETLYQSIRRLDALGETAGLTPDYRWRVNRVRTVYRHALADFREMRLAFDDQLGAELRYRNCDGAALLAAAPAPSDQDVLPESLAVNPPIRPRIYRSDPPVHEVEASPALFFVDNRGCPDALRVVLDGAEVGTVAAGAKEPFQSPAGRHALCLLPAESSQSCGQVGTMRTAYVHDGWSITMHCFAR